MAKDLNVTVLLDAYGQLLTDKQRGAIDLYYNEDFSLAEIAEEMGISRQGVLASIKQGEGHLNEYEEKLGVVSRFHSISSKIAEIEMLMDGAEFQGADRVKKLLSDIKTEI